MNNVQTRSLLHTHTRSLRRGLYTHSHTHTQHLASVCARRCAATQQDTRNGKKNKWRKTISTSASPPSSIQRRKTTTRNGSSREGEWRIDVIRDVDGIEDEIIKAFHLSLQSKDENHSESIINLKRVDTQLLSFDRLRGLTFYQ